jgi:hypothetical protein
MASRADRPLSRRLRTPALALLALNAAVFAVYTLPRGLRERSLARRAASLGAEARQARAELQARRGREEAIRANARDAERFLRQVLKDRSATLHDALEGIHAAAREAGVELGTENLRREDLDGAPITRAVVRMPVTGSYSELLDFLGRLERSSEFVVVDEVRLSERSGAESAQLSVAVSVYFRGDAGGAG